MSALPEVFTIEHDKFCILRHSLTITLHHYWLLLRVHGHTSYHRRHVFGTTDDDWLLGSISMGTAEVTGTAIGGGFLALPYTTAPAGFALGLSRRLVL